MMTKTIAGLSEIIDQYDGFIIDLFGIIHDGIALYPETISTLSALKDHGKDVCFLSNSPRRAAEAGAQCVAMGLPHDLVPHIVTSGETTNSMLAFFVKKYGSKCWLLQDQIRLDITKNVGADHSASHEDCDFILNAMHFSLNADKGDLYGKFEHASHRNIPMICANPDLVVHVGDTLYECPGTSSKVYEEMGGPVIYIGKPHGPVYERAHKELGNMPKDRICAIGDSLHTDIQGANAYGIDSILNPMGIHREELYDKARLDTATKIIDSKALQDLIEAQPHKPTYVMDGFQW